jgi:regulator of protease activity HflC (stomatin/prohibitin superfamily)
LLVKREEISQKIKLNLNERATKFFIIIEDVSITHLNFSQEYSKAVEQKQVASQ